MAKKMADTKSDDSEPKDQNFAELKKVLNLFEESNLTKLEWSYEGNKIHFERAAAQNIEQRAQNMADAASKPEKSTKTNKQVSQAVTEEASNNSDNYHYITTPLVGTFYTSSSPDSSPFVKLGDKIKKGQTLCIVEAMKLMNEIESDVNGTIEKILVDNANSVEYGAKLFAIKVG